MTDRLWRFKVIRMMRDGKTRPLREETIEIPAADSFSAIRKLPNDIVSWDFHQYDDGAYSRPADEVTVRERPEIRNIEDVWCWVNTWGDERKHDFSTRGERDAYRLCIHDALTALEQAGVTFDSVRDEAWSRWTGR